MTLTRQEAWDHLTEWTETESLRKHARTLEIVMRAAAHRYGGGAEDEELWGITGLLHDADYEQWPNDHPDLIVAWLQERGEDEMAYAISAHYSMWGVIPESALDKCLLACDELTGLIVACCLVRPGGIATLTPRSVKKKIKDRAFAGKVDRGEILRGQELLAVDMTEHIKFIIDALAPHAEELGITGPEEVAPAEAEPDETAAE